MKTRILPGPELDRTAALQVAALLQKKPDAVLALCGGRTPQGLYRELAKLCRSGECSLREAKVFSVAELVGLPEGDVRSTRSILKCLLVEETDLVLEHCIFLSEENCDSYDAQIADAGGLDLAVLGIGVNGHIGYNEPAVPFDSLTKLRKLTDVTKKQNAEWFGGLKRVPEKALTMGIRTLCSARELMVLAKGAEKARAVYKMLYARTDSVVPAAFLQLPAEVTVYADPEAAAEL